MTYTTSNWHKSKNRQKAWHFVNCFWNKTGKSYRFRHSLPFLTTSFGNLNIIWKNKLYSQHVENLTWLQSKATWAFLVFHTFETKMNKVLNFSYDSLSFHTENKGITNQSDYIENMEYYCSNRLVIRKVVRLNVLLWCHNEK